MSLSNAVRIAYEPLRSLAFGGITGAYAALGTPLDNPIRELKIKNNTNATLLISFDGVNDHDVFVASEGDVDDYGSNKSEQGGIADLPQGTQIWVKSEAADPTAGTIYAVCIYLTTV